MIIFQLRISISQKHLVLPKCASSTSFRLEKQKQFGCDLCNDPVLGRHSNTFSVAGSTPHPGIPPTMQPSSSSKQCLLLGIIRTTLISCDTYMTCVPCFELSRTWHHSDAPLRSFHQSSYDVLSILCTLRFAGGKDPVDSQSAPTQNKRRGLGEHHTE